MEFWEMTWFIFVTFALVAYLMVIFSILGDLFRDPETTGWVKALWVLALILLPLVTSVAYLVVRGRSMTDRAARPGVRTSQTASYDRALAGTATPAEEIARAHEMYDEGLITEAEYARLKEKALV